MTEEELKVIEARAEKLWSSYADEGRAEVLTEDVPALIAAVRDLSRQLADARWWEQSRSESA